MGRFVILNSFQHIYILSQWKRLSVHCVSLRTPLHYAAANGRYQCTVALVSAGAEVNEADQTGCTPLHYSAASQAFSRYDSAGQLRGDVTHRFTVATVV